MIFLCFLYLIFSTILNWYMWTERKGTSAFVYTYKKTIKSRPIYTFAILKINLSSFNRHTYMFKKEYVWTSSVGTFCKRLHRNIANHL